MSRQFVRSFFPVTLSILPEAWLDALFPVDVAEECPTVALLGIRNPVLSAYAFIGIAVGVAGSRTTNHLLGRACRWFSLMNISGIVLHCWVSGSTEPSYRTYWIWWLIDCLSTGISATHVTAACLERLQLMQEAIGWGLLVANGYWVLLGLCYTLFCVVLGGDVPRSVVFLVEQAYLTPVAASMLVCAPALMYDLQTRPQSVRQLSSLSRSGMSLLVIAAFVMVGGILGDGYCCHRWGQVFYDALTAPTLVFLGCDVAFVGLVFIWGGNEERKHD